MLSNSTFKPYINATTPDLSLCANLPPDLCTDLIVVLSKSLDQKEKVEFGLDTSSSIDGYQDLILLDGTIGKQIHLSLGKQDQINKLSNLCRQSTEFTLEFKS